MKAGVPTDAHSEVRGQLRPWDGPPCHPTTLQPFIRLPSSSEGPHQSPSLAAAEAALTSRRGAPFVVHAYRRRERSVWLIIAEIPNHPSHSVVGASSLGAADKQQQSSSFIPSPTARPDILKRSHNEADADFSAMNTVAIVVTVFTSVLMMKDQQSLFLQSLNPFSESLKHAAGRMCSSSVWQDITNSFHVHVSLVS